MQCIYFIILHGSAVVTFTTDIGCQTGFMTYTLFSRRFSSLLISWACSWTFCLSSSRLLQGMVWFSSPWHSRPPNRAGTRCILWLCLCPSPHSMSHSPQGVHSLHLQSMGQGSAAQVSSSSVLPSHWSPPLTASFSTPLSLMDTPPPQVALHNPQSLHSSQTHGQGWELRAASAAATSDSSWSRCSTLHVHLVILLLQPLAEHLHQASDVLVILVVHNVIDKVQLLAFQGPTPSHLFNFSFNDAQGAVQHVWIVTDVVSKNGPVVCHQDVILCPPVMHVSVSELDQIGLTVKLFPHLEFPGFLPCWGAFHRSPKENCKQHC